MRVDIWSHVICPAHGTFTIPGDQDRDTMLIVLRRAWVRQEAIDERR
jgi:hypothetical protein